MRRTAGARARCSRRPSELSQATAGEGDRLRHHWDWDWALSFLFASWWPIAQPAAAPRKPWWPASCPATPPTAAPLRHPLASAGTLMAEIAS